MTGPIWASSPAGGRGETGAWRPSLRHLAAVVVAAVLTALVPAVSWAAPAPTAGPTSGGTTVSDVVPGTDLTFTSVDAGWFHSIAIGSDGNAYVWGSNARGQWGDGTTNNVLGPSSPTLVPMPDGVSVTAVAAGDEFSMAIGTDDVVYIWGA